MRSVTNSVAINANQEKVFSAFLKPKMLRDWWGVERTFIETKAGGNYAMVWGISKTGFSYITTGVLEEFEPSTSILISNFLYFHPKKPVLGPSKLKIEIDGDGEESLLTVIQYEFQEGEHWDWYFNVVKNSWPGVLVNLKNYLEKITRKS